MKAAQQYNTPLKQRVLKASEFKQLNQIYFDFNVKFTPRGITSAKHIGQIA